MPSCYIHGCRTGYDNKQTRLLRETKQLPKLKVLPKDPDLKAKWIRIIERKDKLIDDSNAHTVRVCFNHFLPDDIIQVKKVGGGFKSDIRPGAVPCIFEDPPHKTKVSRRRHQSKKTLTKPTKEKSKLNEDVKPSVEPETFQYEIPFEECVTFDDPSDTLMQEMSKPLFTLQDLKNNIASVVLPGASWGYCFNEIENSEFVVFMKVNEIGCTDRSLFLTPSTNDQDKVTAVFRIHNCDVRLKVLPMPSIPETITSVEEVSAILATIHKFQVISGTPLNDQQGAKYKFKIKTNEVDICYI